MRCRAAAARLVHDDTIDQPIDTIGPPSARVAVDGLAQVLIVRMDCAVHGRIDPIAHVYLRPGFIWMANLLIRRRKTPRQLIVRSSAARDKRRKAIKRVGRRWTTIRRVMDSRTPRVIAVREIFVAREVTSRNVSPRASALHTIHAVVHREPRADGAILELY